MGDAISIVLGGAAGQGIQTMEALLVRLFRGEGYCVSANKEYMSRIRGGSNSTEIRITPVKRTAFVRRIDIGIPLDEASLRHMQSRISDKTLLLADTKRFHTKYPYEIVDIPLGSMAQAYGNPVFANTIAVGVIAGLLRVNKALLEQSVRDLFAGKNTQIVKQNISAALSGHQLGEHIAFIHDVDIHLPRRNKQSEERLLSGADALGMGVIAGGCNFISSYPMSPGTTLLTFLAQHGQAFGIAVEQAEDEIAAINMSIGAWYAGARAIVTTSGGGFALMEEGVSLSGMLETPAVIHIAQRPGPATGLPTRTEQGDLNLALYAGHGEFPRAILTPGSLEELFEAGQQAFRIADTFQSPVFILTDQYLLDAIGAVDMQSLKRLPIQPAFIKTEKDYMRYTVTKNGISPRGIPGFGEGLVVVDSDEHTEDGHITEDLNVRKIMMEKRMKKLNGMRKEIFKPILSCSKKGAIAVIGWGSTKGVIDEALEKSERKDIQSFHFRQVYPLSKKTIKDFADFQKIVVVENNFTGQFANLLKQEGVNVTETILKYNGEPFCVEELAEKFLKV